MNANKVNDNMAVLQGQIDALQALLQAIAFQLLDRDEFQEIGLRALEAQRDALLHHAVPEKRIEAIDAAIQARALLGRGNCRPVGAPRRARAWP